MCCPVTQMVQVYLFPGTAIKMCHKAGGLKQQHVLSDSFEDLNCDIKVLAELVPLDAVRENLSRASF